MEVLRGLAEAAQQYGGMELERDGDGVLAVMRTAALLCQQLEGLQVRHPELLDCLHTAVDSVQVGGTDSHSHNTACADSQDGSGNDEVGRVLSILDLAFAFGKVMVRYAWHTGHVPACQQRQVCVLCSECNGAALVGSGSRCHQLGEGAAQC